MVTRRRSRKLIPILDTASLAAVDDAHGAALDARRFRLNIVVESDLRDTDWRSGLLGFGEHEDGALLLVNDAMSTAVES